MSAPFYFDGCYLGLSYFDSPPCVTPVTTGGGHKGWPINSSKALALRQAEQDMQDEEEALMVLLTS